MEGFAGNSRPRRRLLPGSGCKTRSLQLPFDGIRPPLSEGKRAAGSPSLAARFFRPERFRANRIPVCVKKTRQNKNLQLRATEALQTQKVARVPRCLASACATRHGEKRPTT